MQFEPHIVFENMDTIAQERVEIELIKFDKRFGREPAID